MSLFENDMPLIGYTVIMNSSQLKIYSLKTERTKHTLRFGSPVVKFKTSYSSKSNRMLVLLQEGLLKIFNLLTMEQEFSIKTI